MFRLIHVSLVASALLYASPIFSQEKPGLRLFDKLGEEQRVELEGFSTADPRVQNAWSVKPVGFDDPESAGTTGDLTSLLVTLSNADSLRGKLASSAGETLNMRLLGGVQIPLLVDHITRIDVGIVGQPARPLALERPTDGDRLYRRTSGELDAIDGTFDSFVEQGMRFDSNALGLQTFPWEEIAALMIEDLGPVDVDQQGQSLPVILDLRGDSRLRGHLVKLDGLGCSLKLAGQEIFFGWEVIEELLVDDGSLLFLSDLPALNEEGFGQVFGDEFEVVWPHVPNGCVWKEGPLRCADRIYRRGIGTHAPTKVSWKVPEGTLYLRGLVGIDDSALFNEPEYRGSVIFRVLVDGKSAWQSQLISGGAQPVRMPLIELKGARQVTLEADMAGSYEGDRANWLEMLFVR